MASKNITPNQVNQVLKNKGNRTPSHYRDGAAKTERSVSPVINAASKTRAMIPRNLYEPTVNSAVYERSMYSEGTLPAGNVSDKFRYMTGNYWTRERDSLSYVRHSLNGLSPFELSYNPEGTDTTEMTTEALRQIGSPPSTSFMPVFQDVVKVRPSSKYLQYSKVGDPISLFERLVGDTVREGVWYEDHHCSLSAPYPLRDIERFTTSINTMYASVKPTYNFFVPEYENSISSETLKEPVLPNMYVMLTEMLKDDTEKDNEWFQRHVTLNNSLRVETQGEMLRPTSERKKWDIEDSLAVQYFDMYGRQVNSVLSDRDREILGSKFSNLFVSHSNINLLKDYNSSKELFPMFTDIEFSTDSTTEFAQALKESGMSSHFMNSMSSTSLSVKRYVEEVRTSLQAFSDEVQANEVISKAEILDTSRRSFDVSEWYSSMSTETVGNVPTGFFESDSHVFLGKADPSLEVTDDPKYDLFRSLMSVVFTSKVRDLVRLRTRTYKEVMGGKPAHTETVLYRIEKRAGAQDGTVLQNFWLPNSNEIEVHKFIDTQVKYGRNYTYTIYAYELVFGSKYKYQDYWTSDGASGFIVRTEPSLRVVEVPYYSYTNRLLDSPPVMPDVEIIPYRGIADRIKINFSGNVGRYDLMPEVIERGEERVHNIIRRAQDRLSSEPIRYESDDHAMEFQVFRTTTHPNGYSDFHGKMVKSVLTDIDPDTMSKATSASHMDDIEPNKKYWYTFRSVDNHGHVSYPSHVYQVEMIDDHGTIYPIIKAVDFAPRTPKISSKQMKRIMQIVPTFAQGILNEEKSGLSEASTVSDRWDRDTLFLGVEDESLWGKKFKIRLTSNQTGRKIDINVVFDHKHLKIQPE